MSAQRYLPGVAHARMSAGDCPECGQPAENHPSDLRFWVRPVGCDLTPEGVLDRVAQWRADQTDSNLIP